MRKYPPRLTRHFGLPENAIMRSSVRPVVFSDQLRRTNRMKRQTRTDIAEAMANADSSSSEEPIGIEDLSEASFGDISFDDLKALLESDRQGTIDAIARNSDLVARECLENMVVIIESGEGLEELDED